MLYKSENRYQIDRKHFRNRLKKRFHERISDDEYKKLAGQIRNKQNVLIVGESLNTQECIITWKDKLMVVIYSIGLNSLRTCYPLNQRHWELLKSTSPLG